jgi:hypothetical protein
MRNAENALIRNGASVTSRASFTGAPLTVSRSAEAAYLQSRRLLWCPRQGLRRQLVPLSRQGESAIRDRAHLFPEYSKRAMAVLKSQGREVEYFEIEGDGGHLDGVLAVTKAGEVIRKFLSQ